MTRTAKRLAASGEKAYKVSTYDRGRGVWSDARYTLAKSFAEALHLGGGTSVYGMLHQGCLPAKLGQLAQRSWKTSEPGKVYVVHLLCKKPKSWRVMYQRTDGGYLLGGGDRKAGNSSQYSHLVDATARIAAIRSVYPDNSMLFSIVATKDEPEIVRHCPRHPPQTLGGKCFGCGVLITEEIARGVRCSM